MLSEVFYLNLDSIELQAERTVDPTLKRALLLSYPLPIVAVQLYLFQMKQRRKACTKG